MKILQICHKVPYPPKDGGSIAMHNLTEGLLKTGQEVKVLSINTRKHYTEISSLPHTYKEQTKIEGISVDTSISIIGVLLSLITTGSYNIKRFYSKNFKRKLIETLEEKAYDIIQLESLYTAPYIEIIKKHSKAKIVLRAHNVEYRIWEQIANSEKRLLYKSYFRFLAKRLKQYEISLLNNYDGIAAISPNDSMLFRKDGCKKPIMHVPFGVNPESYLNNSVQKEIESLFHLGSMDWIPNQEAVRWFLEKVWKKVLVSHPSLKLYIAGKDMPKDIRNSNAKNVVVSDKIKNAIDFMYSKNIMIVPLLSGSGIRIKIIEGMAAGKTIISTSIGAEGILYENGKNILIANTPEEFCNTISKCLNDPPFCERIGKNARELILHQYNNQNICENLVNFYHELAVAN